MRADYLAYALLDLVIDNYFVVLEHVGDRIEQLEEDIISNPEPSTLHTIHDLKRKLVLLRRSVWPLREVIARLRREETTFRQRDCPPQRRVVAQSCGHNIEVDSRHGRLVGDTAYHLPEALSGLGHTSAKDESLGVHQIGGIADADSQGARGDFQCFPGQIVSLGCRLADQIGGDRLKIVANQRT